MIQCVILLVIAYIFNLIDYWQTTRAIEYVGLCVEANPIARYLFEQGYATEVKLIVPAILFVLMGIIIKIERRHIWAAYLMVTMYLVVIINNFVVLFKLGLL